jgi:hypothetical protein
LRSGASHGRARGARRVAARSTRAARRRAARRRSVLTPAARREEPTTNQYMRDPHADLHCSKEGTSEGGAREPALS